MDAEQTQNETQQQPDATGGGQQPAPATQQGERTFTQAELDAHLAERLARERKKYEGFDELKQKAARWAEYEEAQKSELQRAQERADKAERERAEALARSNDALIRAAFVAAAGRIGAKHPDDAYRLADRAAVKLGDDGAVIGAEEAVTALVESGRLPLMGRPPAPDLNAGAGSGERAPERQVRLTPEEAEVARKMGVSPEQYAKFKRPAVEVGQRH